MLAAAEMWVVLLDLVAGTAADQRWILVLARAHQADVVALQSDHFVGGETAPRALVRLPLNQSALLNLPVELLLNSRKRGFAHCASQRIPHQITFARNGVPLEVFLHCITNRLADRSVRLLLARRSDLTSAGLGLLHHTLRLVAVLHGHLPVAALHFFVGDIELGIARSVGGDFRGFGSTDAFLAQVLFDLLAAWAAGFEIFLGVALDLWCSRLAPCSIS